MCPTIDTIKTIVLSSNINLGAYTNSMVFNNLTLPSNCDEVIIKNFSYSGINAGSYFLYSSLSNDYVANIVINDRPEQVSPNTRIHLKGSGIGSVFGGLGSGLGSVAHGMFGGAGRGMNVVRTNY